MNPYKYSLSLRFKHPTISANEIEEALSLKSRLARTVGEPRRTPTGTLLSGANNETYCSFELKKGDDTSFNQQLLAWTTELKKSRSFLEKFIATGGQVEYFIGLFLQGNSGVTLAAEDMRRIQELGIDIAFDIYP